MDHLPRPAAKPARSPRQIALLERATAVSAKCRQPPRRGQREEIKTITSASRPSRRRHRLMNELLRSFIAATARPLVVFWKDIYECWRKASTAARRRHVISTVLRELLAPVSAPIRAARTAAGLILRAMRADRLEL